MPWLEFLILFGAALVGSAAVLPYSLKLAQTKPLKYSISTLFALAMAQNAVIFAVVIALGLIAAHALGLGAPYIEALLAHAPAPSMMGLEAGAGLGIVSGAVLLMADIFFVPYWPPALLEATKQTTVLENFLASFYGGINEELLMRLLGISGLLWLLSFVWPPTTALFWIINIIITILFGVGHLPALKRVAGAISRTMFARSLLLNAPVGLACGWLFWIYGIEAAMVAHFAADIIYHVLGTLVLRRMFG